MAEIKDVVLTQYDTEPTTYPEDHIKETFVPEGLHSSMNLNEDTPDKGYTRKTLETNTSGKAMFDTPIDRELSSSMVNHPAHYNGHPKGIECIDVIEDSPYLNLGTAIKYIWRVAWGNRPNKIQDLEKAIWYIERHIDNLKNGTAK